MRFGSSALHSDIKILSDEESVSLVVTGLKSSDVQSVLNRIEQVRGILKNVLESDQLVEKLAQEDFEVRVMDWVSADMKYQAALHEAQNRSELGLLLLRGEISPDDLLGSEPLDDS